MGTINLGNVVGNRITGISSGIDSEAIIKQLTDVKKRPIDSLNSKITTNDSKVGKYGELSSLLNTLKTTLNYLRNPAGINSAVSNIFEYRTAALGSSTLTPSSYLSVTANPGSLIGTSKVQIGNLAKALEQRSNAFNTRNVDATTAATGSYFTPGTFQIGSGVVTAVSGSSLSGYQTVSADYAAEGFGTGVVTAAGLHNFVVTGGSGGQSSLKGAATSVSVTAISAGTSILSVAIGGLTYSTGAVNVDVAVTGGIGIASGTTFTFTNDAGGVNETSFQITTASDVIIDDTQANLDDFGSDLASGISGQAVYQARKTTNFTDANVKSPLTGLTSNNVKFYTNAYGTTGAFGDISGFSVQKSTGADGAISVDINGETFRVTGLGTTVNTNLVLKSTSTEKELRLNLADAAVSISLSTDANAVSLERSLDYSFGTRTLTDVTVTSGQSLNDVVFSINSKASTTGVSASIIKVNDFDYRFNIKANNEGIDNKYEIFDSSSVLTNTGLLTNPVIQAAEDAVIEVDGIEITRSTNAITDVISNVTLNLLAETPNYGADTDTVDIQVDNDIDTVASGVKSFFDAYNAVRVFYSSQNQRDTATGAFTADSILGGDTTLQNLINFFGNEITSVVANTSSSDFNALSDIGVKLQDFAGDSENVATKNIITYDEDTLKNKLNQNFDKFREIFEFKSTSSSTNLTIFKTSNNYTLSSFKLDIDTSRIAAEQVKLLNADGSEYLSGGNPVYLEASGNKITGKSGTAVSGLEFIYTGDGTDIISVNLAQGIADRLYNITEDNIKEDGLVDTAISNIDEANTAYLLQIDQLQVRLDTYTRSLQNKFSALEAAITSVNNILQLLDANTAAANAK